MRRIFYLAACIGSLSISGVNAALIGNGDFASCNRAPWDVDSDYAPGVAPEISVIENGASCAAQMTIDNYDAYDIDDIPATSNILYQTLDFSTGENSVLWLDLNFTVGTDATNAQVGSADYFSVYFNDGLGNFFDHTYQTGGMFDVVDIIDPQHYTASFLIDEQFYNENGWALEFQLNSNYADDISSLTLLSASFREVSDVSAPASYSLLLLASLGLACRKRKTSGVAL